MVRLFTVLVSGVVGLVLVVGSVAISLFALALGLSEGGSLDGPMLGTGIPGIGVLNGWASLVVLGVTLIAGLFLLRVAWRAMRRRTA